MEKTAKGEQAGLTGNAESALKQSDALIVVYDKEYGAQRASALIEKFLDAGHSDRITVIDLESDGRSSSLPDRSSTVSEHQDTITWIFPNNTSHSKQFAKYSLLSSALGISRSELAVGELERGQWPLRRIIRWTIGTSGVVALTLFLAVLMAAILTDVLMEAEDELEGNLIDYYFVASRIFSEDPWIFQHAVSRSVEKANELSEDNPEDAVRLSYRALSISDYYEDLSDASKQLLFEYQPVVQDEARLSLLKSLKGVSKYTNLEGHEEVVYSANYSADASLIVTASADNFVRVWRGGEAVHEDQTPRELSGHRNEVNWAGFNPVDNRLIASVGDDFAVRFWQSSGKDWFENSDSVAGDERRCHDVSDSIVYGGAFSPNGKYLATFGFASICIWSVATKALLVRLNAEGKPLNADDDSPEFDFLRSGILAAVWGPKSDAIAWTGFDPTIRVFSLSSAECVSEPTDDCVTTFSDSGDTGWVRTMDVAEQNGVTYLVTGSDSGAIAVWDVESTSRLHLLKGHDQEITSIDLIERESDKKLLIASSSNDGKGIVWDAVYGTSLAVLETPDDDYAEMNSARFNEDGSNIVTASDDGKVRLWHVLDGTFLRSYSIGGGRAHVANFAAGGQSVLAVGLDESDNSVVRVFDTTDKLPKKISVRQLKAALKSESTNDANTPDQLNAFGAREVGENLKVAAAYNNGTVDVYTIDKMGVVTDGFSLPLPAADAPDQEEEFRFEALIFDDNARRLVGVPNFFSKSVALVWDLQDSPKLVYRLKHERSSAEPDEFAWDDIWSASFNRGGDLIATASHDKTVHIWDANTGNLIARCDGSFGLHTAAFLGQGSNPGETKILVTGDEMYAQIWDWAYERDQEPQDGDADTTDEDSPSVDQRVSVTNNCLSPEDEATAQVNRLEGHKGLLWTGRSSGNRLVTTSRDGTARIWEAKQNQNSYETISMIKHPEIKDAFFAQSDNSVLTLSENGSVKLWDIGSEEELYSFETGHQKVMSAFVVSGWERLAGRMVEKPGERLITASEDGVLRIWEILPNEVEGLRSEAETSLKDHLNLESDDILKLLASDRSSR